ncbi:MAG: hypothetical protein A3G93_03915 [Nitrospinae bacterium RIFCSPLOWO2_12_FULL_45_22]|nr:MAG: hypothetical protein A3G93_03915 [Nitrospinae bacterium RIFCSPLOWO2_12_FULL_45_22]
MHNSFYHVDDTINVKLYDRALVGKLFIYLKRYPYCGILSLALVVLSTALSLIPPYIIGYVIDEGIYKADKSMVILLGLALFGIYTVTMAVLFAQTYVLQLLGQNVIRDLRMDLFSHIQTLPIPFFDKNPVGRIVTRVANDINTLSELFSSGIIVVIGDICLIFGVIIFLLILNLKLALITLGILPLMILSTLFFSNRLRGIYREIKRKLARINAFLNENISGMEIIQLFGKEGKNFEKFKEISKDYYKEQMQATRYYALFHPTTTILTALAIAMILWYGGLLHSQGELKLGILVAFLAYAQNLYMPIWDLADKYTIFQAAMASAERVFNLMAEPSEMARPGQGRQRHHKDYLDDEAGSGVKVSAEEGISIREDKIDKGRITIEDDYTRGKIEFDRVYFAYSGEDYVLKDISFAVEPGESVAVVGATGAGKTTLMNLLCRFYEPNQGRILLDQIDLREYDKTLLRSRIGIVQQDLFLFHGTVKDNLTLFRDIPAEDLKYISKELGLSYYIDKLPEGINSKVVEGGANLSMGEKQLISFARILIYNPDIIILDEATSNVDLITESIIQEATKKVMEGRTTIVIAHRLSTILNCDKIIVLQKGKLVEIGTHKQLLNKDGIYSKLYQLQYSISYIYHHPQDIPKATENFVCLNSINYY